MIATGSTIRLQPPEHGTQPIGVGHLQARMHPDGPPMSAASLLAARISTQTSRVRGVYRGWWIVIIGHYTTAVIQGAGGWIFGALLIAMQHDLGWSQKTLVGVLTINRVMGEHRAQKRELEAAKAKAMKGRHG